jgi:beta-1,4-mannosyl-glycoprotein beta-1,4-N-acetylglucosaminyltransferase
MKVYDCFLFHNEIDLLELRLETLDHVVDKFVIVEANETFSGKPKRWHLAENADRFKKWHNKIIQVKLTWGPLELHGWRREYEARDRVIDALDEADPNDWIFLSDVDEIWRPNLRDWLPNARIATYEMFHCYYWLNTPRVPHHDWKGTRRIRRKDWIGGQALRASRGEIIANGGWHFSFLGDEHMASEKLGAYAHEEYGGSLWTDPERIKRCIDANRDLINPEAHYLPVPVDDTFPKPVVENPSRWAKFIRSIPPDSPSLPSPTSQS